MSGLVVVGPLGFQARAVVEAALSRLDVPGEELLPVRLGAPREAADAEQLYAGFLRDLRRSAPQSWHAVFDAQRATSAVDRFEYSVMDLLEGPLRQAGRKLLLVVDDLDRLPPDQSEQIGYLLSRLAKVDLKLLLCGGQELHDLRTRPSSAGHFSAFHVLQELRVGELSLEEVLAMVAERGGGMEAAAALHWETGGHPALVEELLVEHPEEALTGEPDLIAERILVGTHMEILRRAVESDSALPGVLTTLATVEGPDLPRRTKTRKAETRLFWLGVLKDAGPRSWTWVAPAMRRFAGEWGAQA